MFKSMHPTWKEWLADELAAPLFKVLVDDIALRELQGRIIYPFEDKRLRVFQQDPSNIRAVIVGQDPYHGPGQAVGLSFSVDSGVPLPPSLRNIYQELNRDISGSVKGDDGNLTAWEQQGVFLLNSILTVEAGSPASHKNHGWEVFTSAALAQLSQNRKHLAFLLWGKYAQKKGDVIKGEHLVIRSAHPSPFSAHTGFFGSRPFSKTNDYLLSRGIGAIDWQIGKES
jgi:uracil-DNA glycosylase